MLLLTQSALITMDGGVFYISAQWMFCACQSTYFMSKTTDGIAIKFDSWVYIYVFLGT
jgi:hypothetical protein